MLLAAMIFLLLFSCTSNLELPPPPPSDSIESDNNGSSSSGGSSSSQSSSDSNSGGGSSSSSSYGNGGGFNPPPPGVQCLVSGFQDDKFIDPRDCNSYTYIYDGNGKVWMMENLNYSRNNTLGWCYKIGTDANILGTAGENLSGCDKPYGRHYTYDIAMDGNQKQGLCPSGWNIPSVEEWEGVHGMPSGFYVKAGKYYSDASDPSGSIWKDRTGSTASGYYWTRNIPSGNSVGYALVSGTSIDVRSPGALNAATKSDRFSVRCFMDAVCGSGWYNPLTQRCVNNIVKDKCGNGWYDKSTQRCATGDIVEDKCGDRWYDKSNSNFKCESSKVMAICGSQWYDTSNKFCDNGTITNYTCTANLSSFCPGKTWGDVIWNPAQKTIEFGKDFPESKQPGGACYYFTKVTSLQAGGGAIIKVNGTPYTANNEINPVSVPTKDGGYYVYADLSAVGDPWINFNYKGGNPSDNLQYFQTTPSVTPFCADGYKLSCSGLQTQWVANVPITKKPTPKCNSGTLGDNPTWLPNTLDWTSPAMGNYNVSVTTTCNGTNVTANCGTLNVVAASSLLDCEIITPSTKLATVCPNVTNVNWKNDIKWNTIVDISDANNNTTANCYYITGFSGLNGGGSGAGAAPPYIVNGKPYNGHKLQSDIDRDAGKLDGGYYIYIPSNIWFHYDNGDLGTRPLCSYK